MLAIVIPFYKLFFFEETLQSLANQTDKRFKVYIGNDASPENPNHLLEKYQGQFEFIYHRFESNLGGTSLVKQWERCIAKIENEKWIMILGDDDYLETNVVAKWYQHYDAFYDKSNVIRFASKSVNMKLNGIISDSFTHPLWEKAAASYFRRFKGLTRSTLSEYVFSKESFLNYGFHDFPLAWHSDDAAWLDFSDSRPIYTINDSNVFVRFSIISISGNNETQNLKDLASVYFIKKSILNKFDLFKKNQQIELALYYEVVIKKNRKLKYNEWLELFFIYAINLDFLQFTKCFRRFMLR
ncbi:Glycosyltransferase involved in cell wall bisynthesis [Flavobacterium fryxellicola]|uniref:Glycosyl transferase n=1 Tax=Flavobacterium fryxellicola TaxID=249352 RepID=A0A167WZ43_9FLAO|nr:glycosyltransferase family 2 protein [Flavobacterium fryxellicola]OAB27874.1 glycosyl transferase [Flavobacterium fryxellicola]SHN66064.1 Glycosyltransferase involved in cell wall bisynthesis [Flavobacterium fryxellicola]